LIDNKNTIILPTSLCLNSHNWIWHAGQSLQPILAILAGLGLQALIVLIKLQGLLLSFHFPELIPIHTALLYAAASN
jgi:hypothetical protein